MIDLRNLILLSALLWAAPLHCLTILPWVDIPWSAQADLPADIWRFYDHTPERPEQRIRIAIIIDDIGHQRQSAYTSAHLPGAVTLAVLPHSPYAQVTAEWAQTTGKELMLHIPMQPKIHRAWGTGLTLDMNELQVRGMLTAMLDTLPNIRGVNNHMGSALTPNAKIMSWVMQELAYRNLYFVDSRTSAHTRALSEARKIGLPSTRRDIFLDNQADREAIQQQFEKLITLARKHGSAVAIGHPYPETLAFLEQITPSLAHHGIDLVPVSQLLTSSPVNLADNPTSASHANVRASDALPADG